MTLLICCDHEAHVTTHVEGCESVESMPCHDGDSEVIPYSPHGALSECSTDCYETQFLRGKMEQRRRSTFIHLKIYGKTLSCTGYFVLINLSLAFLCEIQAFTMPLRSNEMLPFMAQSKLSVQFSTAMPPEELVTAVKPQTKRKTRRKSSRRNQSLVGGLTINTDASIPDNFESYLDFLEDSFPAGSSKESISHIPDRPKGRPASVAGATSRQTLKNIHGLPSIVPTPELDSGLDIDSAVRNSESSDAGLGIGIVKEKRRGRPRKKKENILQTDELSQTVPLTKGERKKPASVLTKIANIPERVNSTALNEVEVPKKLWKVKNLPPSRAKNDLGVDSETTGMMAKEDISRYYRTELLSAHEEYELGMKVQFMMKSEEVYKGLHLKLVEQPTIKEWAAACGFILHDDSPVNSEDVDHIRPLDEISPEHQDPNMFVGKGLVNTRGPGRGKGRVKGPLPTFLEDFYYDIESEFEDVNGKRVKKKITPNLKPINRGTPQDFVNMMLEGKLAKQRMVQCNMRLVVSISKRYNHVNGVSVNDLIQEGSIGLSRAAEKFEPLMGFKFSTYASWWIQQAVFRAIAYHSRTIRLPVHVHNHLNLVRRVRQEMKREKGRTPTNEEMAEELNMTVEKYNKMLRLSRKAISLDIAKYQNNPKDIGNESEMSLGDTIDAADAIKDENTPEQNVNRVLFRDDLKEMLKILGDDERAVIKARYGLDDGLTATVTTVAAKMGQTKAWVRSAECCALRKLRRPWYEKRLWEHQNSLIG